MPYVVEDMTQLEISREEAEFLAHQGILVQQEGSQDFYDTTAWIWDDLNLQGDDAFDFIEIVLKGFRRASQ